MTDRLNVGLLQTFSNVAIELRSILGTYRLIYSSEKIINSLKNSPNPQMIKCRLLGHLLIENSEDFALERDLFDRT